MLRGINKQQIFEEQEDYYKFLDILKRYKPISKFELYAYCLMGNHIHLLIKVTDEPIEQVFKRVGGKFVYWYNVKYQRVGHLFQDRFKSEPVETNEYFWTVIRYIHQNPVKAGLCKKLEDYPYSSYREYVVGGDLADKDFVLQIKNIERFIEFNNLKSSDKCLDISDPPVRVTDEQAKLIIRKISKCDNATEFQALDEKKKHKCLTKLKENGLSIRQISRLTGISVGLVRKD